MPLMSREGWRQAGFELVIVFLGVLIALLVDGWNERRVERAVEQGYLDRLAGDVAQDSVGLADLAKALEVKMTALESLEGANRSTLLEAPAAALVPMLVQAHTAGFGVLRGVSTTFEDLQSTGHLGLIRDPQLRAELVAYYESWRFNADRVQARRSTFPSSIYSFLPPSAYDTDVYFDAPAAALDVELDREPLVEYLYGSDGRRALIGEMNYARFFAGVIADLRKQARNVLVSLD